MGPVNGRDEADVTLPLRRDLGDFELRMSEVVRTLGRVEKRPEAEILQDLLTTSSDLIRVRAPSREADSGSLPLEQAVAFVERSRDLVMAAACAAVGKRASYDSWTAGAALDILYLEVMQPLVSEIITKSRTCRDIANSRCLIGVSR